MASVMRARSVGRVVAASLLLAAGSLGVHAQERTGVVRLQVTPDHADWTYVVGAPVAFRVSATRDGHPLALPSVTWKVGPEMLDPVEEKTGPLPAEGLTVKAAGLKEPGFVRLVATAALDGQDYRALATAGFAPERITPTVEQPADFDAFWAGGQGSPGEAAGGREARTDAGSEQREGRLLAREPAERGPRHGRYEPTLRRAVRAEGRRPFPALLQVPGAGVRAYGGNVEMAEKGVITLQIGIHGLPVNLDPSVYQALGGRCPPGAIPTFNLDERDRYYYRRVYLGCVRANDFLVTRPRFDGRTLGVTGGSQGGALSIVTAGLDPRVRFLAAYYPALADVTGYLHGRAGGWPHMFRDKKRRLAARIANVGLLRRRELRAPRPRVPGLFSWATTTRPVRRLRCTPPMASSRARSRCCWPSRPATSRRRSRRGE